MILHIALVQSGLAQTCDPHPKEAWLPWHYGGTEVEAIAAGAGWLTTGHPTANSARVWSFTGTGWHQGMMGFVAPSPGDQLGAALAMDGETLVVGAPGTNGGRGLAYVHAFDPAQSTWALEGTLSFAPFFDPGDGCGTAVAIDGDTAAVGCPYADYNGGTDQGAVQIFERTLGGWSWQQQILAPAPADSGAFGLSVDLDGNNLIVGEPGSVHFYAPAFGNWSLQSTDTGPDRMGEIVQIHDGVAVAAAPDGGWFRTWSKPLLWSPWTSEGDTIGPAGTGFASSIDLDERLVVGATDEVLLHGERSGTTRVYERTRFDDGWLPPRELGDLFALEGDAYGASVAIAGDLVGVAATGATLCDAAAPGYVTAHNLEVPDSLVISEIFPGHPSNPELQWVEIFNRSDVDVDASGIAIGSRSASDVWLLGGFAWLYAGDFRVVALYGDAYLNAFGVEPDYEIVDTLPTVPNGTQIVGSGDFDLDPEGDGLVVFDSCGAIADGVSWGTGLLDQPGSTCTEAPAGGHFTGHLATDEIPPGDTLAMGNELFDGHTPDNWLFSRCIWPRMENDINPAFGTGFVRTPADDPDLDVDDLECADAYGHCSLRAALEDPYHQTITFCLRAGQTTIQPTSALPPVDRGLWVRGDPDPVFQPVIDGGLAGAADGFETAGIQGVWFEDLTVQNFQRSGFALDLSFGGGIGDVTVRDNGRYGVDASGDIDIVRSQVEDNTRDGVRFRSGHWLLIADSDIRRNRTGVKIIDQDEDSGHIIDSRIEDNSSDGVQIRNGDAVEITHTTFGGNGGLAIDLQRNTSMGGATSNDDGDGDTGGNGLLNKPYLIDAYRVGADLHVVGYTFAGAELEFFRAGGRSNFSEPVEHVADGVEGSLDDLFVGYGYYSDPVVGTESNVEGFRFVFGNVSVGVGDHITATATNGTGFQRATSEATKTIEIR